MVLQHNCFSYLLYLCLWDHGGVASFWLRKCLPTTSTRVCCGVEVGREMPFPGRLASASLNHPNHEGFSWFLHHYGGHRSCSDHAASAVPIPVLPLTSPTRSYLSTFRCSSAWVSQTSLCVEQRILCWVSCPTCKFKRRNKGVSSLCRNADILILGLTSSFGVFLYW